jgi:hypothetical protein
MNRKKLFFDSEFTGLRKNSSLISLGVVSEDDKKFYAIFDDYNRGQVDDWIEENVIDNLSNTVNGNVKFVKGNKDYVADQFLKWLEGFGEQRDGMFEMWSDLLPYDWVLFCDMFGETSLELPKIFYYIPFDICTLFEIRGVDPDISREEYSGMKGLTVHNSLSDAIMIKKCYEKLMAI